METACLITLEQTHFDRSLVSGLKSRPAHLELEVLSMHRQTSSK